MSTIKTSNLDKYIFTNCKIYSPNKKKSIEGNILVVDGVIKDLNFKGDFGDCRIIDCENKIIAPSFLDLRTHFGEPGAEDTESLRTGSEAAIAGGYSKVCVLPNTDPTIDDLESLQALLYKSKELMIDILPIGAITKNLKGAELSEIGLMANKGIVAISDGHKMVENPQIMRHAMEYAKMFDIPIINHPEDVHLKNSGIAHESQFSTEKGLPANPWISETIALYRDLEIADYLQARIHIPHISSKESLKLIDKYKRRGLKVTAEVTPHHLGLSESKLDSFDALYKISPPLRSEEDREALIEALKEGVLDCISSDHFPHKIEDKESDLLNSESGVIGLESAFSYSYNILSKYGFSIEQVIDLFAVKSRQVIGIPLNVIAKNEKADFIVIDPEINWIFQIDNIFSKSKNSALIGEEMKGKINMVVFKNKIHTIN